MNYFDTFRNNYSERYSKVRQDDEYYYLYKHFSYGAKDTEWEFKVLDTLLNCSLLFSKPNTFNDPFDCLSSIEYDFSKVTRMEMEQILNKRITNKDFKLRKHIYIRELKEKDEIKNWGDHRRNGFHLTCFNNSPLNILMWSHYAGNHQGFMIEFKFKKLINDYTNLPVPVNYCNIFPKIIYPYNASSTMCMENSEFGAEAMIKLFSNKAECWSYEDEFRLVNLKETLPFDKAPVKVENELFANVIFGHNTNEKNYKETLKAVDIFNQNNNMDIKTYRAKMMPDRYELYVPNHPRLDKI